MMSRPGPRHMPNSFLILSALGEDRPGIVNEISKVILDAGCNIVDSRMTVLGGDFAVLLMVTGNWNTMAKLEASTPGLEERLRLTIISKRTAIPDNGKNMLPYAVEVISIDHPGIVHHLAEFFSQRNINIRDMATNSYAAAHTGTPMFAVHIAVDIPADMQIAALREEFMDFCDQLNLDAVIEPIKV